jgi:hypothetical protein
MATQLHRRPYTRTASKLHHVQGRYLHTSHFLVRGNTGGHSMSSRPVITIGDDEVTVLSRMMWKFGLATSPDDEVIGSGCQVNALRREFVGEGLPAVDLAHGDLA